MAPNKHGSLIQQQDILQVLGGGLVITIKMLQTGKNPQELGNGSMAATVDTPIGTMVNLTIGNSMKTVPTCMMAVGSGMIWIAEPAVGAKRRFITYVKAHCEILLHKALKTESV